MRYREYPAYKESGVEWLGAVPEGWEVLPLKYTCSYNDETLSEKTPPDYQIEYVDISSVDKTSGISKTETLSYKKSPSRARRIVRDGDIIISTVRTYLEAVARIQKPPKNLIVSTGFAVVRPQRNFYANFAFYAVRCRYFIESIVAYSVGVSYPAINASELVRLHVVAPSISEQIAIANFLDRETKKIDTLIAKQQKLIKLLQEKRQAVISHAVTKGLDPDVKMKDSGVEWLGEVPEHWDRIKLKQCFKQNKRQGYSDHEVLSVYRDYGVVIKSSRNDNHNKTPENLSSYQLVEEGDLVINIMKAWQGSLGISQHTGITSPDYVVYSSTHKEYDRFFHYLLRNQNMPDIYKMISNGIRPSQWRIEPEKFEQLFFFMPPTTEQQEIVEHISNQTTKLDAVVEKSKHAITLLQERRTALISAAVTGKIDVRNPD